MARRQVRLLAGASAAALLASGVVAAGASGLAMGVTVPGVGSVEARLPAQQVPSVTVPSVTVPSVTVPSVPPLPAPEPAPVPSPPSVQTPSVQTPTVQAPSAPAAPSVGAVQQQADSAGTRATAPEPSTAGAGGGTAAASAGSGASSSSAGQGSAGPADAPSGVRGDRILAGGGWLGHPVAGVPAQRRLELAVERARQCLDDLGPGERRVLDLRAGVGPGTPLSRSQVARRLGLGVSQTRRIERRGLRRLDTLASAGACGGATSGSLMAVGGLAIANGDATLVAEASDLRPRSGVGGVVAHGGDDPRAGGRSGSGFDPLPPPIGDGGEATLLVALCLLVALALLVRRELSRR